MEIRGQMGQKRPACGIYPGTGVQLTEGEKETIVMSVSGQAKTRHETFVRTQARWAGI